MKKEERIWAVCLCCSSDYMFLLFSHAANEAGETPLDIARRLKHLQCEELVSSLCLDQAYACKQKNKKTKQNTSATQVPCKNCLSSVLVCHFLLFFYTVKPSAGREIQRPRARRVWMVPAARRPGWEWRGSGWEGEWWCELRNNCVFLCSV